jgi:hypothetical protein
MRRQPGLVNGQGKSLSALDLHGGPCYLSSLGWFSLQKILQNFSDFPSHRIFRHIHEALNIDKKIKLITQFKRNPRDESFKPS